LRRPPKQKPLHYWCSLFPHYPIFKAKKCFNCKQYFQFEWGWRWLRDLQLVATEVGYLCKTCASTRQEALDVLKWQKTEEC